MMLRNFAPVPPQLHRRVQGRHRNIKTPVAIEVCKHGTAMQPRSGKLLGRLRRHIFEFSSVISEDPVRLRILHVQSAPGDK